MQQMLVDRRTVNTLLGGGLLASLVAFLYPVLRFLRPPSIPEAQVQEAVAGTLDQFPPNSGRIVKFGSRPVLVIRASENDWRAFSGTCTHLNCTVQYQSAGQQIWCACHNGLYDLNGKVISGPPPRPLEEYQVRLRGREVIVARKA